MNHCHFIGNLTRDPELKTLNGDNCVLNFGIAVNRTYKDKSGEKKEEVSFLELEAWGAGAKLINQYFKKGNPILVHCSAKQDTWDDKDTGTKRSKIKFKVENFEFLPTNSKKAASSEEQPADAGDSNSSGSDIPF